VSDQRTLLSGTAVNAGGLVAGVAAAFGAQLLIGRRLGPGGLGLVTVAVQAAFVAAAGSRFGMDLAAVREVAIGLGAGRTGTLRSLVDRCALLAFAASMPVAAAMTALSPLADGYTRTLAIAAASVPFAAAASVYLGATRGMKAMTPTLWVFWIGQPLVWIGLAGVLFAAGGGVSAATWSYDVSWAAAALAARVLWRQASAHLGDRPAGRDEVGEAIRFGLPRAPAALLAQALFWADLWVLSLFAGHSEVGTYAAVGRVSQVMLLFVTSVGLMFAPFAADLYARGAQDHLDRLFKQATRWGLVATLPVVIVLAVAATDVLAAFGPGFTGGDTALRILLAGQLVNVMTGSVAFVLIMAGRTGLDLADNLLAVAALVALAAPLSSAYGMEGAAIASTVAIGGVNLLRLVQVARIVRISPYTAADLRLAVPAAGCALAGVAVHLALRDQRWPLVLAATAAAAGAAYAALLPAALPADERRALYSLTRKISNRAPR
jgi:O-antigen/teichoic acid export membrane protein